MNRFHTLPESPQVLRFHLNQFDCCRFRNISQLTNYWQLPHSVIWSHVGSSPNLRYWCLDQNCTGRSKSQQPQGTPGFFLYSDRCGGYKDLSIGCLRQRWQSHREDAERKWVLLTLALDQGSSVFPILFLSCLFHLSCFKHPLAVFVGQGSNVQKLVKYSFVNSLSRSCCFGEQSFPSIINLRPWADQLLHPSTERKSWLLSHISNRKHHLTF